MKNKNLIAISGKIGSGKDTVGKIIQILTSFPEMSTERVVEHVNKDFSNNEYEIKKFADKLKNIVCILIGCTKEQLEDSEFKNTELGEEWDKFIKLQTDTGKKIGNWFNSYEECSKTIKDSRKFMVGTFAMTPRLMLQLLGTECGREILHPNIWVNALMSEYKRPSRWENRYYDEVNKKGLAGREEVWGEYPNWIITDTRFENELKAVKDRGGITIRVNRPKNDLDNHKDCIKTEDGYCIEEENNYCLGSCKYEHESETMLDDAEFDYTIDNNSDIISLIEKVKTILIKEQII